MKYPKISSETFFQHISIIFFRVFLMGLNFRLKNKFSPSISGNIRRFRRICEHIQAQVCSKRYPTVNSPINQKPITQIQAPTTTSSNSAVSSESISCGSDSSDRINYNNRQNDSELEVETFFDCNTTTTVTKPRRSSASSNKNSDDGSAPCSPSIKTVSSR